MKKLDWKRILFCAVALIAAGMTAAGSAGVTGAYFTTYTTVSGTKRVYAEPEIKKIPDEDVENLEKTIYVENLGDQPCWARVLIVCPEGYTVSKTGGNSWHLENGYWYYSSVVPAHGSALETLKVEIQVPSGSKEDFSVVVIEQCVPVVYRSDGKTEPADWTAVTGA